jgi:ABC-type multidrug transport system fused ATPase/permease subunit
MHSLLKYLKNYPKQSILAPLFKLLEAFLDLLVPLITADLIDNGVLAGNRQVIMSRGIMMAAAALLGLLFSVTAQYFSANAAVGAASDLRQNLFDHIQKFSYKDLDRIGVSTLVTRMTSDINQIQTGLNMTLRLLLRSPFIVFGSVILAFTIDFKCACIFAAAVPVLAAVTFFIMYKSIPLFKKVQKSLDKVLQTVRENLNGVRVIRAFRRNEDETKEFMHENRELTDQNLQAGRLSAIMNPAVYVLINIAAAVLIEKGALQVNLGILKQGQVVALYNYMAQMIIELVKLSSLVITINKSIACADRVSSVLSIKPDMTYPAHTVSTEHTGSEAVSFEHVSMVYEEGAAESLSDISFKVNKGETVGIIGGTGSGKSTMVNLIPRLYDATAGIVRVDGKDTRDYTKRDLIQKIGIVPQKAVLLSGTIRDNMKWGQDDADDSRIMCALDTAMAMDVVNSRKEKLDYRIEQNGANLSGGQKQRLTIARALVSDPEILILDDSGSALDYATDASLRKNIHRLCHEKGMTAFIVSQRCSSIKSADRILVLSDGTLAGEGTHEQLLKNCDIYREIYYSQYPDAAESEAAA